MTTYEHCARVMSRSGEARVIRLGIERNMSRVVVTEFTGVTWADNTPEHCSTAVVVEVALRVVEEGSTAVGR
ncbi:hypothetical protein [Streptomyces aidingensis]|nr:hypothetical protein [Streptomyces aidingensis]